MYITKPINVYKQMARRNNGRNEGDENGWIYMLEAELYNIDPHDADINWEGALYDGGDIIVRYENLGPTLAARIQGQLRPNSLVRLHLTEPQHPDASEQDPDSVEQNSVAPLDDLPQPGGWIHFPPEYIPDTPDAEIPRDDLQVIHDQAAPPQGDQQDDFWREIPMEEVVPQGRGNQIPNNVWLWDEDYAAPNPQQANPTVFYQQDTSFRRAPQFLADAHHPLTLLYGAKESDSMKQEESDQEKDLSFSSDDENLDEIPTKRYPCKPSKFAEIIARENNHVPEGGADLHIMLGQDAIKQIFTENEILETRTQELLEKNKQNFYSEEHAKHLCMSMDKYVRKYNIPKLMTQLFGLVTQDQGNAIGCPTIQPHNPDNPKWTLLSILQDMFGNQKRKYLS